MNKEIVKEVDELSSTERNIIKQYINYLDTNHKIILSNRPIVNFTKIIYKEKSLESNTIKKIYSNVSKSIDTTKKVTNEYIYLLDTQRKIVYGLEKDFDIIRDLYNFHYVTYDTWRKVTVPINKLRDTLCLDFKLKHGALYKVN